MFICILMIYTISLYMKTHARRIILSLAIRSVFPLSSMYTLLEYLPNFLMFDCIELLLRADGI